MLLGQSFCGLSGGGPRSVRWDTGTGEESDAILDKPVACRVNHVSTSVSANNNNNNTIFIGCFATCKLLCLPSSW